jgi:peptidoglycan/LPS O-acetylase OafA/YrhL
MGFLRIYLALSVIAGHTNTFILPWPMHSGAQAVQIFYLVSGFYMALVSSKYNTAAEFYTSRFMRIFIPYWTILAGVLVISSLSGLLTGQWLALEAYTTLSPEKNGALGIILVIVANVTLFFQDWILFLKHDAGQALSFTTNWRNSASPLWKYLVIPQAWSVGVELAFYLLVPWLNKQKTKVLGGIVLFSLLLRILAYETAHLTNDPWTYRFFPFELATFLLGMLSFRAYAHFKTRLAKALPVIRNNKQYLLGAVGLLGTFFVAKGSTYVLSTLIGDNYAEVIASFGWAILLPVIYHIFGNWKPDRVIGELSYPVYLLHIFVIELVSLGMIELGIQGKFLGIIGAIATLAVALVLFKTLFQPIENRRQEYVKRLVDKARSRKETPAA